MNKTEAQAKIREALDAGTTPTTTFTTILQIPDPKLPLGLLRFAELRDEGCGLWEHFTLVPVDLP